MQTSGTCSLKCGCLAWLSRDDRVCDLCFGEMWRSGREDRPQQELAGCWGKRRYEDD